MKMRSLFLIALLSLAGLTACLDSDDYISLQEQLELDIKAIDQYLDTNNISAAEHESGLRYIVSDPGEGDSVYDTSSIIVNYEVRNIDNGALLESADSVRFPLYELYLGWRIGLPLIREGGKITLYLPRVYADGRQNMVFDIELLEVD